MEGISGIPPCVPSGQDRCCQATGTISLVTTAETTADTCDDTQGMIVAPELLAGVTDSSYWAREFPSTPILRFTPNAINRTAGDLKRIHGVDERVGCSAYLNAIRFYVRYMQTSL